MIPMIKTSLAKQLWFMTAMMRTLSGRTIVVHDNNDEDTSGRTIVVHDRIGAECTLLPGRTIVVHDGNDEDMSG